MRDRDERSRQRSASRRSGRNADAANADDTNADDTNLGAPKMGDPQLGDTNLGDEATFGGSTEFDESFGRPENIVGGPSAPGTSLDPSRPLAEGANDSARDDLGATDRDRNRGGSGNEGIAGERAGGSGP